MADRRIVYTTEVPRSVDVLGIAKDSLVGLGYLAQAAVGGGTAISGLGIAPTGPASLSFTIGVGSIYTPITTDATAYSTLGTDAHVIVKQGILADPATLTITPPATSGFSQVFLVQVGYLDQDGGSVVPPYYDSTDPTVPFNGAGGMGGAQNTIRQGLLVVQLKAGTAASTGSQTTPAPDAGFSPVWIVTVANGATTITSANWKLHPQAPFFPALSNIISAVQNDIWVWAGTLGGSATVVTATTNPPSTALVAGQGLRAIVGATNTGPATLNRDGLGAMPIVRSDGTPMIGNEMLIGGIASFIFTGSSYALLTTSPSTFVRLISQTTFYVNGSTGDDTLYDGTSATIVGSGPHGPWATVAHAVTAISKFQSANAVTINVAAGTYVVPSGADWCGIGSTQIAGWNIIGTAGAGTTIVNATATGARGVVAQTSVVNITGITISAYYECFSAQAGGTMIVRNCAITGSAHSSGISSYAGSQVGVYGTLAISGSYTAVFAAALGQMQIGYTDVNTPTADALVATFGTTSCSVATVLAQQGGVVQFVPSAVTFAGITPTASRYSCSSFGSIGVAGSGVNYIPGNSAGVAATATTISTTLGAACGSYG